MHLGRESLSMPKVDGPHRRLSQLAMLAFVLGYWIFIWRLERVDYGDSPPQLWQRIVSVYPLFDILTPRIVIVAEFLSFRVLRHFLPLLAGGFLASVVMSRFLAAFYELPDAKTATSMLNRLRSGRSKDKPFAIKTESFDKDRRSEALLKIGGPGRVAVSNANAVVTERNGRFSRVIGPGSHNLKLFEYPVAVIDTRPQEREADEVSAITADGIELTSNLSVTFQINTGKEKRTKEQPFPFDKKSVRDVAYAQTNLGEGKVGSWEAAPTLIAAGQLGGIVAKMTLDKIILPEGPDIHVHRKIKNDMEHGARQAAAKMGVRIRGTRLGALEPPEAVRDLHLAYWKADWDGKKRLELVEGDIATMAEEEKVRVEAEAMLIESIAEALFRAQSGDTQVDPKEIIALRLVEVLEVMARQSEQVLPLPNDMMPTIKLLREQLLIAENINEEDENKVSSE